MAHVLLSPPSLQNLPPKEKKLNQEYLDANLSINVHKAEAVLLALQIFGANWTKTRVILYTDSSTAKLEIDDFALKSLVKISLRDLVPDSARSRRYLVANG